MQAVYQWYRSRAAGPDGTSVEIRLGSAAVGVSGTKDPAEIRRLADLLKAAYPEAAVSGTPVPPCPAET